MLFLQKFDMDKIQLSKELVAWLPKFIQKHYVAEYEVLEIHESPTMLSKLNSQYIKFLPNYSSWEFSPDILGVLRKKSDSTIALVLINRAVSGLSLKEIGELHCYAKLAKANFAFLVSTSGVSNEVNILLVDKPIRDRLLNFAENKTITIFTWNEDTKSADKNSVLPIEMRNLF